MSSEFVVRSKNPKRFNTPNSELITVCQSVMPDLIRHPEGLEKTGFRLSPE